MIDKIRIVHLVHRFDIGGLENGLVNLVNNLPWDQYQHTIISLTEVGDIQYRILNPNVELLSLGKRPGKDPASYLRLYKLLRQLRPATVHTRNLGTLDAQFVAWIAGVRGRIHSEHGRDDSDPNGTNKKQQQIRRIFSPLVQRWVCVSRELEEWCANSVGLSREKLLCICNGVDVDRFKPLHESASTHEAITFGSVLRFSPIKDPGNLVQAFAALVNRTENPIELLMVGDGPLLSTIKSTVESLGLSDNVKFTGMVTDTADVYRQMDVFVLGSRREGMSNTLLEAMASGLPIIATDVGNANELVDTNNGYLVPPENAEALSVAMLKLVDNPLRIKELGTTSRLRAEETLSLQAMCDAYHSLYLTVSRQN